MFNDVRLALIEACGGGCVRCHRKDLPLELGHIRPRRFGGTTDLVNLQPICRRCNASESSKNPMKDYRPDGWYVLFLNLLANFRFDSLPEEEVA